jgi:hypothetical protein
VDGRGLLLIADSENHRIREWRDLHASPVTMSPGPGVKSVPLTPRPPAAQPPAPLSPPPGNGAGAGAGAAGGALSPQFRKPGAAGR